MGNKKILVVEDDVGVNDIIRMQLENSGYDTIASYSGKDVIDVAKEHDVDLIILDIGLPHKHGFEVCTELEKYHWDIPVVMLSGYCDEDTILEAEVHSKATFFEPKPFDLERLLDKIQNSIQWFPKVEMAA